MAQWLRAGGEAAPPEDWDLIPSTYMAVHKPPTTPPPGDLTVFWPPWAPDTHVMHRNICRENAHTIRYF